MFAFSAERKDWPGDFFMRLNDNHSNVTFYVKGSANKILGTKICM